MQFKYCTLTAGSVEEGYGANHPYLQAVAELQMTQVKSNSKGILNAPSADAIQQLTTDHAVRFKEENRRTRRKTLEDQLHATTPLPLTRV